MGHTPHFSCSLAAARSQCVHSRKTRHGSIACICLGREFNSHNTRSSRIKLRKYQINSSSLQFFLVTTLPERAGKVGDSLPSVTESNRPFLTNFHPKKTPSPFPISFLSVCHKLAGPHQEVEYSPPYGCITIHPPETHCKHLCLLITKRSR